MSGKRDFRSGMNNAGNKAFDTEFSKLSPDQKRQFSSLKDGMQKYQGKSNAEIMDEIQRLANQGRADGSINDQTIEEFKKKVAPMLDQDQKKRLDSIVSMLKGKRG